MDKPYEQSAELRHKVPLKRSTLADNSVRIPYTAYEGYIIPLPFPETSLEFPCGLVVV